MFAMNTKAHAYHMCKCRTASKIIFSSFSCEPLTTLRKPNNSVVVTIQKMAIRMLYYPFIPIAKKRNIHAIKTTTRVAVMLKQLVTNLPTQCLYWHFDGNA